VISILNDASPHSRHFLVTKRRQVSHGATVTWEQVMPRSPDHWFFHSAALYQTELPQMLNGKFRGATSSVVVPMSGPKGHHNRSLIE
jgi:hypothetical protein